MSVLEQLDAPATAPEAPAPRAPVSRRLAEPLGLVAGRARLLAILLALFQLTVVTLGAWLFFALLLGSIRNIPASLALVLAAAAWITLLGGTFFFFRPALRRTDLSATARLVDAALPDTDERISSALELTQEIDPRFKGSPELIAALLRQAEHAAESLDPNAVISGKYVFRWFLSTVPLLALWFVLFVIMTPTLTLGMQRLFQPWRAAAPLPTATLEVAPQNITKAQGDSVDVTLNVTPTGPSPTNAEKPTYPATITRRYTAGNTNEDVTTDMIRTGSNAFVAHIDNVQQTFSYRVSSLGADSPTYTVTVDPRPGASAIQVDYNYPAYTGRPPHSDSSREGAIDALVGTHVKLTIDTNQPVKSARLVITDNAPDPGALLLQPLDKTNTRFTTEFTVRKTTDYKLQLTNDHDLENNETQPRPIIARLDAPPTIAITSPLENVLKVRPDDTLAVRFTATDDLALTKIEAVTQIDDHPPAVFLLPAIAPKTTTLTGTWSLSLPALLSTITVAPPAIPAPKRITYQLRAYDNRDPDAQVGLSAKQTLDLDQKVAPLAERQDTQAARTLSDAVKQAGTELDDAKSKLDKLRQTAAARPLNDDEKQQAAEARREINHAAQTLQTAADKTSDSRLGEAAQQAREIANQSIRQAEENTAAGQLAADQADARNKNFEAAGQNLADAHQKLDQLARAIDAKAKDQPLAHELERIAAEQKRLADALAKNPNDPALLAQQRQLQQDLEKVIQQHPELQKPAAEAAQNNTQDVQKKLDDIAKTQQPFNDQAKAKSEAAIAQDKLNDLARQQENLNQQINDFNNQNAQTLRQAEASHSPATSQLEAIPKDLRNRNLQGATQGQNATANQLEQTAQQLENAQRREQSGRPGEQGAKEAADLQTQANDLQKQIEEAQKNHNPPTRPSDPANQEATRLADQIKRQAQQQAAQSPAQRAAAKQASDEADAAKREAAQGNAASAQQHLVNAANQLAGASGQSSSPQNAGTQNTAQAAAKARELAQQQRSLADQTSQTNHSLDTASSARANAEQSAQQQQQLADKMEQAAQAAHNLEQQTKGAAPDLSDRAGQAAQSLQKAADAQRAAAEATRSGNNSQAQSQQTQAANAVQSAQQSLQKSPEQQSGSRPSPAQSPGQKSPGQSGQSASNQSSPSGQQSGPTSPLGQMGQSSQAGKSGQSSPSGQSTSSGQSGPSAQSGTPGQSSGQGESSSAAQAVQAARNAQSQAASGNPRAAQQAADQLSQASQQLLNGSGTPSNPSAAASPGRPASDGQPSSNSTAAGGPGSSDPAQSNANANAKNPGNSGSGLRLQKTTGPQPLPKSVEEIGVSPSDWAKLPSNMQEQLLNSAQQSGPPAYRDMIKNYYSRIAQLEQQPSAPPTSGGNQ